MELTQQIAALEAKKAKKAVEKAKAMVEAKAAAEAKAMEEVWKAAELKAVQEAIHARVKVVKDVKVVAVCKKGKEWAEETLMAGSGSSR